MKKYRNITQTTLAIDCLIRTVYIRPGEIATLPETRDVRYYAGIRYLVKIKEPRANNKVKVVETPVKKEQKPRKPKQVAEEIKQVEQKEDNGE